MSLSHIRTELHKPELNRRLKCHVTTLTSIKFITGFPEWEWQWVLMVGKCHSYTVYPRTADFTGHKDFQRPRENDWVEMRAVVLKGTYNHKDHISATAIVSASSVFEGRNGEISALYLYA